PALYNVSIHVQDHPNPPRRTADQTVTVNNVAPTVALSAANDLSVDEGSQHTYSFSVSDPGVDTFTVESVSCGLNGVQVGTTTTTDRKGTRVSCIQDWPSYATFSVK